MKLIHRSSERTLMRRHDEPYYQPWSAWEVCEATEGFTHRELIRLVREWHRDEHLDWCGEHANVRGPYGREEYRIVPDDYKV